MQAVNTTFRQLIEGTKQFVIPVFQRDYAWGRANWQQLWDDITRTASADGDRGHFVGSIVHIPDRTVASKPSQLVIDGQQRLTTLTILCAALRDHIKASVHGPTDALPTPEQIEAYFISNTLESGDFRYKLRLRRTDNETLKTVVDGRDFDTLQGSKSARIVEAYEFYKGLLDVPEADLTSIYRGVSQLRIVEISLDRALDDPQVVFESINSTGVRLTQGDLVRNYLLMGLQEQDQTRLYQDYWSRIEALFRGPDGSIVDTALNMFLRDYIALKQRFTQEPQMPRIYEQFKQLARNSATGATMSELESRLGEMLRFARYYAAWDRRIEAPSPKLTEAVWNLRHQGNTTGMIIMKLFDRYETGGMSEQELIVALRLIESYLVRHAVCGRSIRSYWRIFAGMIIEIDDDSPAKSLYQTLAKERGTNGFWTFPSDEDFTKSLQTSEIYHSNRIIKDLLDRLENDGQGEPSPVDDYSIEHIMPQKLTDEWRQMLGDDADAVHAEWCHRLGNLTLTAYNQRYSNRSFEQKKTIKGGFNESAVRLNLYVKNQPKWTVAQMEERGDKLAQRALHIWPYPAAS